ncbi:Serine/threonine-protein kinase pakH [Cytospora mali]|uniref:Serine/threonine-protein kinase pakH n=1 Tax=Cytospora mali TaxID=578113 RepID=A0A194VLV0_CYTMA|nr:Serine/threonine-protein kinase pakH [Valsa mali]
MSNTKDQFAHCIADQDRSRYARALRFPTISPHQSPIVEFDLPSRSTRPGSDSSLISTLPPWGPLVPNPPSQQSESFQEFHTALSTIHTEVDLVADWREQPGGVSELAQRVDTSQPHLDVLPRLRILFTDDRKDPGPQAETKLEQFMVLGAVHSHGDAECNFKVDAIQMAILFVPWKDQVLFINNSLQVLRLTSEQDKLVLKLEPRKSATIDPGHWAIRKNDGTWLRFLLRPSRYVLLFEIETRKRAANTACSASKRMRVPTEQLHGRVEDTRLHSEQVGKAVVRSLRIDEIDSVSSCGIPIGHTLTLVDKLSGEVEYSFKRLGDWEVQRSSGVVFKAIYHKASSSKLVIPCIASLIAFDARLLVVAVELKHAYDLSSSRWCYGRASQKASLFKGTIDDACKICTDIASALEYLERKRIVHNDIKAANILYSEQGAATLIDFGLSKFVGEGITTGGTPWYKDPEFRDDRNTLSDVFSFGVVMLYVMGQLPLPDREPGWSLAFKGQKDKGWAPSAVAWVPKE